MRSSSTEQPRPRAAVHRVRPGFSLVELLLVMFVISLLAYVAVPRIEIMRFKVDGAARGSVATLVAAQRLAVKRQHDVIVAFDTGRGRLFVHQDSDNDGVRDTGERVRAVSFEDQVVFGRGSASALGDQPGVVTFTERQDGLPVVRFIRNGSASEEGTFYLTSTRADRAGKFVKDSRAVQIDRSTGRVTWYRYEAPEWVEGY